ncbi:MAG TPA: hypothetical protein VH370_26800 [Humisphaera sp.]|jgi:hypothetical protein|nr:hypothetical protein [Humisphaera sp.]
MSMMRFGLFFRELAIRETRCITVTAPMRENGRLVLPADTYGLDEMYCVDPGCDCRRVMFNVLARYAQKHVATINHGFEPPDDPSQPPEQTFLDPLNRQSQWSAGLLDLVENVVLTDEAYCQRLRRHYHLVKAAVNDPAHPCQELIRRSDQNWDSTPSNALPVMRRSPIPPPARRGKRKWR